MPFRRGVDSLTRFTWPTARRNMAFALNDPVHRLEDGATSRHVHSSSEATVRSSKLWRPMTAPGDGGRPARPTHFLCFPLVTPRSLPQLASSLEHFRDLTTTSSRKDSSKLRIIPSAAHRPAGTFHLTLLTLTLPTSADLDRAGLILAALDLDSLGLSQPLSIALEGLGAFPSPRDARVLYAPPVDSQRVLLRAAGRVRDAFLAQGLGNREERGLTLHATIANMRYVTPKGGQRYGSGRVGVPRIDARQLVEVYNKDGREVQMVNNVQRRPEGEQPGKYVWVDEIVIDRLALCRMGAVPSDDPILGATYPRIFERLFSTPPQPQGEVD